MTLQYANASVEIFCFDFRPAGAYAASGKAIGVEHKSSVALLRLAYLAGQRSHRKVREDAAIHGLETKVCREVPDKIQVNAAVDGSKVRVLSRIFTEGNFDAAIHRARAA